MKIRFVFLLLCLTYFSQAGAAVVDHNNITASTSLIASPSLVPGDFWTVDELADGITDDFHPYFGFVSAVTSGTISLDLDATYDLDSFTLWNDVFVGAQGVRDFRLEFFDVADGALGQTMTFTAVSQLAGQTFAFDKVFSVASVDLVVLTAAAQIEIRELAFNGELSGNAASNSVPVPASIWLFAMGLLVYRRLFACR